MELRAKAESLYELGFFPLYFRQIFAHNKISESDKRFIEKLYEIVDGTEKEKRNIQRASVRFMQGD